LIKNIAYAVFFAGLMSSVAFGSVEYTPSRPCNVVNNCFGPACQSAQYGYMPEIVNNDTDCAENRDFQQDYVEPEEYYAEVRDFQQDNGQKDEGPSEPWFSFGDDWYIGANVMMNMWSWKNEYDSNYSGVDIAFESDIYSFERVLGGSLAVGNIFDGGWRAELEVGMTSEFKDESDYATYTMAAPYLVVNVYHDFDVGLYIGAGAGVARPETKLDLRLPTELAKFAEQSWSPKASIMFGYMWSFNDRFGVDFKYRLSGFKGNKMAGTFLWDQNTSVLEEYDLHIDSDFVVENTFSAGVRYKF
jgi:opacity protein-like surface antigen